MPQITCNSRSVDHAALRVFCAQLLQAVDLDDRDAALVADTLVESNLRGIDSHGVARLPHYLRRIQAGSIHARPNIAVQTLGAAAARVHGDAGLGQLVMDRATTEAIALAAHAGAGWVSVVDSSHCGALAWYGLRIADAGMIGIVLSHVDSMVLPYGAIAPFCGTNPICITAPRSSRSGAVAARGALCLDMATSVTPWNTVANAAQEGVPIPSGLAVDADGNETTDPQQVAALHAFGGHKGSGLGLMIDVLCALLGETPYGPDIPRMYGDLSQRRQLGGLVGAIDIGRFVSLDRFHARVDEMVRRYTSLPAARSHERVLYPGEPELITRAVRLRDGLPLGLSLLSEFDALAELHGIAALETCEMPADVPCLAGKAGGAAP